MGARPEPEGRRRDGGPHLELRVSDLKQFVWCPRIVFFSYVMPVEKAVTYAMEAGRERHLSLEALESRRTLRRYGLAEGERHFRVPLASARLGLAGILDLLIVSGRRRYPVEFKDAPGGPALPHRYQLAAYGLLVEERWLEPVRVGFLYIVPGQRVVAVPLTGGVRERVRTLVGRIRRVVSQETMPPGTRHRRRCRECEYRNYCADWA